MRTALILTALLATTAGAAFAEDDIHQDVILIQTTTVETTTNFDQIEPAAGPAPKMLNEQQYKQLQDNTRYDDANFKG